MNRPAWNPIVSLFKLSDEQAMGRVQQFDDPDAFAQLMHRWERPIHHLCARLTGDADRSRDLVQEAFARIYRRRKEYVPQSRFSTYLWRIALNLCYDELRKRARSREDVLDEQLLAAEFDAPERPPDRSAEARDTAEQVQRALLQLPEILRTILVLRHYEDLKFREIAEVLQIPEGTVKSRMSEALDRLGKLLKPVLSEVNRPVPIVL